VVCPLPLAGVLLLGAVLAGAWWWYRAADRRLLLLGLGCIFSSYLLVYSARAEWPYTERPYLHAWNRYHLIPQLGLTLFVIGGWPRRRDGAEPADVLSRRQVAFLGALIGILFVIHLPRGIIAARYWHEPGQMAVLRQIDEMDARCRRYHIDRDTARAALDWLEVPGCYHRENGWELLRGSSDPYPVSVAAARQMLGATLDENPSPDS
jgi:hypothetical protein